MLQYIINATAIWLFGLIVFDLFLRNEASHGYNRFYLLIILGAGALIPLWSWDYDSVIYSTGVSKPLAEQSAIVKQTIVEASESSVLQWEQWLMTIYVVGAGVVALWLTKDLLSIIKLYRVGTKSKDGTWTIIETGKQQSPFSAFRYVFISSKSSYTHKELQMILAHEEQHGHLLHFIDVLIFKIAGILFWFNPVIYLLEKRLLTVHEYQADASVNSTPSTYGRFLIEQSVLNSAPVLAHSFIRSPLKKRIIMLTRKTTALARGKQLLLLPVLAIAMLSFTENAFSWGTPQKNGDKYSYRGNIITYSKDGTKDTIEVEEPITKKRSFVVTDRPPSPIMLNNEKIYSWGELTSHTVSSGYSTFKSPVTASSINEYLLTNLDKEISKLKDGEYTIGVFDVVVDKEGAIVFFRLSGVQEMVKGNDGRKSGVDIDFKLAEKFGRKISVLMNSAPKHRAARFEGKNVHSLIESGFYMPFVVKNGKLESIGAT